MRVYRMRAEKMAWIIFALVDTRTARILNPYTRKIEFSSFLFLIVFRNLFLNSFQNGLFSLGFTSLVILHTVKYPLKFIFREIGDF